MKIMHTSDWHLGMSDSGRLLDDDQRFFLNQIYDIIRAKGVEAVIIAGDVFNTSTPAADAIVLYDEAMEKLCVELGVDVISIAGNHDSPERLASCSALLSKAGLHVEGRLKRAPKCMEYDDVNIYMLPWFMEQRVKSEYPEKADEINSLSDAYQVVLNHIAENMDRDKKNILVSHAFITDSETSGSDRAALLASAEHVGGALFKDFDYVALGHIHKPQDVNDKIRYCGTPMPYSFGKEEEQIKSVTIIDTDTMEHEIVPLELLHKRTTLTGTLDELLAGDCPDEVKAGYVRLVVTDKYVSIEARSRLEAVYEHILEVQGKSFENANASITMTMDEFRQLENDPVAIFKNFCMDTMKEAPSDHLVNLFKDAMGSEVDE